MTNGRGFIALAASSSATGARSARTQPPSSSAPPPRSRSASRPTPTLAAVIFQALPYVLTLIAVAGVIGRSIPPAAVGRPYAKQ